MVGKSECSKRTGLPFSPDTSTRSALEDSEDDIDLEELSKLKPPPGSSLKSTASVESAGSKNRQRLALRVEKQLLRDIEAEGGLHFFGNGRPQALRSLLDNPDRTSVYGQRGDDIRKRIGKRVDYWKRGNYVDYKALLESYDIEPAKLTSSQRAHLTKKQKTSQPVKNVHTRGSKENLTADVELSGISDSEDDQEDQDPIEPDPLTSSFQPDPATSSFQPDPVISSLSAPLSVLSGKSASHPVAEVTLSPSISTAAATMSTRGDGAFVFVGS